MNLPFNNISRHIFYIYRAHYAWSIPRLKITIKDLGPEITSLIKRDKVIDSESDRTVDNLFRRLEEEIRAE